MSAPAAASASSDDTKLAASTAATVVTAPIPITVFSGFLGAGKTTILLNLVKQLQGKYKVAWLKNEYGEVAVDSRLAAEDRIDVTEVLNGCICCTAVGKLGPAIKELIEKFKPDRILLETSGSSHPAPVAWEIRRLAQGAQGLPIVLDALICVIDCVNFAGYEDRSRTARLQTKLTDLLLINKHELVSEQQLEAVMDDVFDLNPETPKIKTDKGFVDQGLLIGLDSKLWESQQQASVEGEEALKDAPPAHEDTDVRVLDLIVPADKPMEWTQWKTLLASLSRDAFYRVKGVLLLTYPQPIISADQPEGSASAMAAVPAAAANAPVSAAASVSSSADTASHATDCSCGSHAHASSSSAAAAAGPAVKSYPHILNWAFGRVELRPLTASMYAGPTRVSFMGDESVVRSQTSICSQLNVKPEQLRLLATQ